MSHLMLRASHEVVTFVIAALPPYVWMLLVTWLFARRLRQPIPLNPFKRTRLRLRMDLGQHILLGVLSFGVSLAMFDLTDRWLRWKLYRDGPFVGSVDDWIDAIAIGVLAGMLSGLRRHLLSRSEKEPDVDSTGAILCGGRLNAPSLCVVE